jgi:hypothetical protein
MATIHKAEIGKHITKTYCGRTIRQHLWVTVINSDVTCKACKKRIETDRKAKNL